jgi:starch phosphorylase
MSHLAIVGSHSVNGVAALHSKILKTSLFKEFAALYPDRFTNITNGITQRRWLYQANRPLNRLISSAIGEEWVSDLSQLEGLAVHAEDPAFRSAWMDVRLENKRRLARYILRKIDMKVNPGSLFDVQVKRIHEYKRQLLNVLHVIHLYSRIKQGDTKNWTPRCVLIGGKAAPGYHMAKLTIKLINNVAEIINGDPDVGDLLKVAFLPNYNVSAMEVISPGTDLSEQISTAGKEASGTGNMKFMMNGAVTIGTYDGANIEILEAVGEKNFFLFGLKADEVEAQRGDYRPNELINADPELQAAMNLFECGHFNLFEPHIFDDVIASLKSPHDPWLTLADFRTFVDCQQQAAQAYQDRKRWTRMSILNTASSGFFSTDRTMQEYNAEIWKL